MKPFSSLSLIFPTVMFRDEDEFATAVTTLGAEVGTKNKVLKELAKTLCLKAKIIMERPVGRGREVTNQKEASDQSLVDIFGRRLISWDWDLFFLFLAI